MLTAYSPGSGLDKIRSLRFPVTERNARHSCLTDDKATDDFLCVSVPSDQAGIKRGALTAQLIALFSRESDYVLKRQPVLLPHAARLGQSFKKKKVPQQSA